ncbi:MAG: hypothetical protein WAZ34_06475 [Rhodocyclaceae bacterium]
MTRSIAAFRRSSPSSLTLPPNSQSKKIIEIMPCSKHPDRPETGAGKTACNQENPSLPMRNNLIFHVVDYLPTFSVDKSVEKPLAHGLNACRCGVFSYIAGFLRKHTTHCSITIILISLQQ